MTEGTESREQTCRICGCTDYDCSECIEKTGTPCHWVEEDLCSACKGIVDSVKLPDGPCCERWGHYTSTACEPVGAGLLYPTKNPEQQIVQIRDGTWSVWGCCGGGCHVVTGIKFCPFCGAELKSKEDRKDEEDSN